MKLQHHTLSGCVAAALLAGNVALVSATPVATSNDGWDYLGKSSLTLSGWSCGVYGYERGRDADHGTLSTQRAHAYVGYDIFRWLTPYIAGGESRTELNESGFSDWGFEWGAGVTVSLLDKILPDPYIIEDRVRITGGVEFTMSQAELRGSDVEWSELYSYLTFGLINDLEANKDFVPNSIGVYAGPCVSVVGGDELVSDNEMWGYTVGMDIFYSETVTLQISVAVMDDTDFGAGVQLRF